MGEDGGESGQVLTEVPAPLDCARRRYLLYCLRLYSNPVRLSDVAYQITVWEGQDTGEDIAKERHRTYMSLYHDHLPELVEADLVAYDQQEDVVELGPREDEIADALDRALCREVDSLLAAEHSTFGDGEGQQSAGGTGSGSHTLPETLYRVLAAPERRQLLTYLLEHPQTTLDEAADVLVGWRTADERAVGPADHDRIRTTLHHVHLPALEDAGLVTYDLETEEVRLSSLTGPVREAIRSAARYHRTTRPDRWPHE